MQYPVKPDVHTNSHVLFRKVFFLKEKNGKYLLHISADDYYKLYINGRFVCMGPAPGYPFHYYYNETDISQNLVSGKNTIAEHTNYKG